MAEDEVVRRGADALLLAVEQLARTQCVEGLHYASVGLRAFGIHFGSLVSRGIHGHDVGTGRVRL
jgi:hypothetical protein